MNELIVIRNFEIGNNEVSCVSARTLYLGLGLAEKHWAVWHKTNISNNEYFTQDVDYIELPIVGSGNNTRDFAVSTEFAKHIAMQAKTKKSHEYRNYMLACEKQAAPTPLTRIEALRALADSLELIENKELEIKKLEITLDIHHGYASVKKMEATHKKAFPWKPLKAACTARGITCVKVHDQNYAEGVNAYPADVWLEVYGVKL